MTNPRLNQFTSQELEQELLSRQKCQFNRLTCTQKAEDYLTKPFNYHAKRLPTCFNCKQDILSFLKTKNSHDPQGHDYLLKNYE